MILEELQRMSASHPAQPLRPHHVAIGDRYSSYAFPSRIGWLGIRQAFAGLNISIHYYLGFIIYLVIATSVNAQSSPAPLLSSIRDQGSLRETPEGRPPALADRLQESDLIRRQLTLKGQRLQEHWANVVRVKPAAADINRSWLEGQTRGDEYLRRCEHIYWQIVELRNDLEYFQQLSQSRLPAADEGLDRFPHQPNERSANQSAELKEHLQRLRQARQAWQEQLDQERQQSSQRSESITSGITDSEIESLRRQVFAPNQLEPFSDESTALESMVTWEQQCELIWRILSNQHLEMQTKRWESVQRAMPRQIEWLDQSIDLWQQHERGEIQSANDLEIQAKAEPDPLVIKPQIKQSSDVATAATEMAPDTNDLDLPRKSIERNVSGLSDSVASPGQARLENRINQLRLEQLQVAGQIATLRSKLEVIQQKIQSTGLNASNTALLLDTRRNLPLRQENRQAIRQLLEENRLETLEDLNLMEKRELLRTQIAVSESQGNTGSLDIQRAELVDLENLVESQNRYLELLSLLATEREALDQSLESVEEYLNYQLLWVRESEPFGRLQTAKAWEGVARIVNPGDWFDLAINTAKRIWQRPYESFIAIVGLASLAYCTRWLRT